MKRLWIAVGLLLTVIALCVGSLWWQTAVIHDLQAELESAVDAVYRGAPDAMQKTVAFHEHCRRAGEQFAFLARHEDSGSLRESAALLPTLLERRNTEDFFAEVSRCQFFLTELEQAEKPLFGNIF